MKTLLVILLILSAGCDQLIDRRSSHRPRPALQINGVADSTNTPCVKFLGAAPAHKVDRCGGNNYHLIPIQGTILSAHYNSQDTNNHGLGVGLRLNYDSTATVNAQTSELEVTFGDGSLAVFLLPSGVMKSPWLYNYRAVVQPDAGRYKLILNHNTHIYALVGATLRLTQIQYPNGRILTINHDAQGRVISVSNQDQQVTSVNYDNPSRPFITTPEGRTVTLSLTGGFLTSIEHPGSLSESLRYESLLLTRHEDVRYGYVTFGYDSFGRIASVADAKGSSNQFFYGAGFFREESGTKYILWEFANDAFVRSQNEAGLYNVFNRDNQQRLLGQTDAFGHSVTRQYNDLGYLWILFDGRISETREYDSLTNVIRITRTNGTSSYVMTRTFDSQNRLTQVRVPGRELNYSYQNGRVRITDGAGNLLASALYQGGKLSESTDVMGNVKTYVYDGSGRLSSFTDDDGLENRVTYDNGFPSQIEVPAENKTVRFERDEAGRVTKRSVVQTGGGATFEIEKSYTLPRTWRDPTTVQSKSKFSGGQPPVLALEGAGDGTSSTATEECTTDCDTCCCPTTTCKPIPEDTPTPTDTPTPAATASPTATALPTKSPTPRNTPTARPTGTPD